MPHDTPELIPQRWYLLYTGSRAFEVPLWYVGRTTGYGRAQAYLETATGWRGVLVVEDTQTHWCNTVEELAQAVAQTNGGQET